MQTISSFLIAAITSELESRYGTYGTGGLSASIVGTLMQTFAKSQPKYEQLISMPDLSSYAPRKNSIMVIAIMVIARASLRLVFKKHNRRSSPSFMRRWRMDCIPCAICICVRMAYQMSHHSVAFCIRHVEEATAQCRQERSRIVSSSSSGGGEVTSNVQRVRFSQYM